MSLFIPRDRAIIYPFTITQETPPVDEICPYTKMSSAFILLQTEVLLANVELARLMEPLFYLVDDGPNSPPTWVLAQNWVHGLRIC